MALRPSGASLSHLPLASPWELSAGAISHSLIAPVMEESPHAHATPLHKHHPKKHHKLPLMGKPWETHCVFFHPLLEKAGGNSEGELRIQWHGRLHSHANICLQGLRLDILPWDWNDRSCALNEESQISFSTARVMLAQSPSDLAWITPINLGTAPEV